MQRTARRVSRNEISIAVITLICGKQGETVGMESSPKRNYNNLLVILPDSLAGSALSVGDRNSGAGEGDKCFIKAADPPNIQALQCFQQLAVVALRAVHDFVVQGHGFPAVILSHYCHN